LKIITQKYESFQYNENLFQGVSLKLNVMLNSFQHLMLGGICNAALSFLPNLNSAVFQAALQMPLSAIALNIQPNGEIMI